jgi:Fungal specific transcription factor domain
MYQKDISLDKQQPTSSSPPNTDLREAPSLKVPQSLRIDDEILNEALSLFFLYQYPQFMFVHREAFLRDYYGNVHQGKYWSYPLLYAICALGARGSPDARVRDKGDVLSHCAETIIMTNALGHPHITVAQALLCLAFYELGSGNHSKGWILAGLSPLTCTLFSRPTLTLR